MNNRVILIVLALVTTLILISCSPEEIFRQQLDKAMSEEIIYITHSQDGFSIQYPEWPESENNDNTLEVGVTMGFCTVIINQEQIRQEQWYDSLINSVEDNDDYEFITEDKDNFHVKTSSPYLNFTMLSDTKVYGCNDNSYAVSIVCISEADEKAQHVHNTVFNSATCEEEAPKEQTYFEFEDDDYIVEYPGWTEFEDENSDDDARVLAVTQGVCTLLVNKHNALPEDIINWLEQAIEEQDDHELLKSSSENDVLRDNYYINYELPYEDYVITTETKLTYCNYMTYITQFLCVNELVTDELEEVREKALDSVDCMGKYEIPTPEIIEEQREELVEEEPEVIEEIEDEIVQTDVGEEFGIDEEMVVYFINSNSFFKKVLKDYPKINIVFEDEENDRELELKINIGDDGKIEILDDGKHSDPDVTITLPLRDALNIFSNAANINPITLIGFAINVQTDPASVKDEVIQNVLQGKYN
ncbi:MAG: hypothetical protein ABIG93_02450 [archaeon]|nr:hypothetical protein [Nanoarchaeota archaeon]